MTRPVQVWHVGQLGEEGVSGQQAISDGLGWQYVAGDEGRAEDDRSQERLSEGLGKLHFDDMEKW